MIRSFKSAETAAIARGERVPRFIACENAARRKLWYLEVAARLGDLKVPLGNRLEVLRGYRSGQFSIRINEQYRVCFRWVSGAAEDVEIVDYH